MSEKSATAAPALRMIPVPEPVLRGLVEYLSTRPYREVAEAVPVLLRLLAEPAPRSPEG